MRLSGPALPPPRVPTIADALQAAAGTSQALFLVGAGDVDTRLAYADLDEQAHRAAAGLAAAGVRRGDRVALSLPTGQEFLALFFGIQYAAAVPVPIAPPSLMGQNPERARAIGRMLRSVQARLLVTQPALMGLCGEAARAAPGCRCVAAEDLLHGAERMRCPPEPSDIGLIQFSSGSTTDPKPVALRHAQLVAQVSALEALLQDSGEIGVSWLPMHHDMGLVGSLLCAVYHASPLALLTPEAFLTRPASWLRAITRHRAALSPAPNFAFRQCLLRVRESELEGLDLSSWRVALCGGEAVSPSVLQQFAKRFERVGFDPAAFRPAYGLAESSLAVTSTVGLPRVRSLQVDAGLLAATGRVCAAAGVVREIVSVGCAVPGAEVEIRDADQRCLGPDQVGRVCTRGPSVMEGYFGDAEATARVLREGWLDTGDLGFIHDGELYISGRAKELVIIRGSNHAPQEFEDCLVDVEGLRSGFAAVAAGFTPPGGEEEELLLLVERGVEAADDLPRRITAAILARTGIKPGAVVLVERGSLPRTTSGKLRRAEALRRYLAGELRTLPQRLPAGGPVGNP